MNNLRLKMDKCRKDEIKKIEDMKNSKIKELTDKHDRKYTDIKDYYFEITNTNLDIIRFLKEDLQLYRHDE
jgi:growth arrest-specific protein 8